MILSLTADLSLICHKCFSSGFRHPKQKNMKISKRKSGQWVNNCSRGQICWFSNDYEVRLINLTNLDNLDTIQW